MTNQDPPSQAGASLVELVVGLGLVALVVLPMLTAVATSTLVVGRFTRSGQDAILARSQIESILRQRYQAAATPYATVVPFSGFSITHSVATVTPYTYPTPISPTPTVVPPPETLQLVTVTVDFGTGSYQLGTIKTNRKLR